MEVYYSYKRNFMFHANPLLMVTIIIEMIIFTFLFNNPVYLAVLFLNLILISLVSKTLRKCLKFVKYIGIIGLFVLILNLLLNRQGTTVIFYFQSNLGYFVITAETLAYSLISILQLVVVMYSFALMNIIINPDDLMKIMLKIRMPYVMALLITLTIRFFPQLVNDLKDITDVQRSRGFEIDKGSWLARIKNRMVLLLPLLTNSLEKSIQVSEALESRAFRIGDEVPSKKTPKKELYQELSMSSWDRVGLIIIIIEFAVLIYAGIQRYGVYGIYPTLSPLALGWNDLGIFALFSGVTILIILIVKLTSKIVMKEASA